MHLKARTIAAALGGLTLVAGLTAATATTAAAQQMCAGEPATLVSSADRIVGTEGPDVIVATSATLDEVHGLGGDDLICVEAAAPRTSGFTIDAGSGEDTVNVLGDLVPGDVLTGGHGRDRVGLYATAGRFYLDLDQGVVRLGAESVASVIASDFEDASATGDHVTVQGSADDNQISVHACELTIRGGAGDDELRYVGWEDSTILDACTEQKAQMLGGPGDDELRGTPGDDYMRAGTGDDVVQGAGGDDLLTGGNGKDLIRGGGGDDRLIGDNGHDRLWGGPGDDLLSGKGGDDTLKGGKGRDQAHGGKGGRDLCRAEMNRGCER